MRQLQLKECKEDELLSDEYDVYLEDGISSCITS